MKFIYLLLANSLSKSKTPEIPYVGMVIVWWPITRKISHDTWANNKILNWLRLEHTRPHVSANALPLQVTPCVRVRWENVQQFAATNRLIFATCFSTNFHCIDKDFHKHFASTHKALCHCDMSLQRVAANCLLVCSDLALLLLFVVLFFYAWWTVLSQTQK